MHKRMWVVYRLGGTGHWSVRGMLIVCMWVSKPNHVWPKIKLLKVKLTGSEGKRARALKGGDFFLSGCERG